MVFKKKVTELAAYQTKILMELTEKPKTSVELYKATHDPYSGKRAAQLVKMSLVAEFEVHPKLGNGRNARKLRPAWSLTDKGRDRKTELVRLEAELKANAVAEASAESEESEVLA